MNLIKGEHMILKIAIVGFGNAGFQAVKAIRQLGKPAEIHVYSDKSLPPSNPMLTTYYVKESIPYDAMFPYGFMKQIQAEYGIVFHADTPVYAIDGPKRAVLFMDGSREIFDRILIATGALPFLPSTGWAGLERVMVMRTPEDACRLKETLDKQDIKSILVVGASMIGIKIAELARQRGIRCTMVDGAPYMFPMAAFESTADRVRQFLTDKGTLLSFSALLSDIRQDFGNRLTAVMKDGRTFTADIILVCIGTRANTACIRDDSIKVNRGILVDSRMMTNCEGVYAAGDCSEGYELQSGIPKIIGLWANAGYQGRTAGINMAGGQETFKHGLLCNISHFMGMDFIGMGDASGLDEQDEVYEYEKGTLYLKAVKRNGTIKCINMLDGAPVSGIIKNYFMKILDGRVGGMDMQLYGILVGAGIPGEFIGFMGGKC